MVEHDFPTIHKYPNSKCSSLEAPPSYQDALSDDYYSVDTTARAPCPSTPPPSYSSLVNCS